MVPPESNTPHEHPPSGGAEPPPEGPHPWQQGAWPPPGHGGHGPEGAAPQGGPPPDRYGQYGPPPGGPPGQYGQYGPPPQQPSYGAYAPQPTAGAPRKGSSAALWWILGTAALVLVLVVTGGGVAAYLWLGIGAGSDSGAVGGPPPGRVEPGDVEGVRTFDDVAREHTEDPVSYDVYPPPGGEHHPVWQNCGVYRQELMAEHVVHSLEHGAVWISYSADLSGARVDNLERLYSQGDYLIVSPAHPRQQEDVVAVAWGKRLVVDTAGDRQNLIDFLNTYVQGPQTPEPGAPCSGGTDATTQAA